MGFSVSGATAIILVGLLVSAAAILPAIQDATDARTEGVDARDERMLEQRNTAINVTDAVYHPNNETLTVRVENTGTTPLDANLTDLLVDGEYTEAQTWVDGETDRELWSPASELRLEQTVETPPARIVVVTQLGVETTAPVAEVTD